MSYYNLTNIAKLYGGGATYNTCKHNMIEKTMNEFKNKKLKTRADKTVSKHDMAIAIALSQVHSNCKRNKSEETKLINKVNKDLNDIIETYDVIKILLKNGKKVHIIK